MHGTVEVPHSPGGLLAAVAGVRRARRFWSASATWTRATGAPTCRAARSSSTGCSGWSALASLMAIFMQVIAARLGVVTGKDLAQCCRDWYPALDALAELAAVRDGHRRLRPGRGAGQRGRAEPAVPHPAALGGDHHRRSTCCCCWPCSGFGMRTIEAVVLLLVATIGVCYFIEIFVLPQTQPELPGDGPRADHARASARRA